MKKKKNKSIIGIRNVRGVIQNFAGRGQAVLSICISDYQTCVFVCMCMYVWISSDSWIGFCGSKKRCIQSDYHLTGRLLNLTS